MKLQDQVTSLELSKRLKELGVKQESFFAWTDVPRSSGTNPEIVWLDMDEHEVHSHTWKRSDFYAAFTATEAEVMLPREVNISYKNGKPRDGGHWLKLQRVAKGYNVMYLNRRYDSDSWLDVSGETIAEASGLMLAYLLEHNLINPMH